MNYKMTGDSPSFEEGDIMNGKEVSKGKGMGYEMIGSDPKVAAKEAKSATKE